MKYRVTGASSLVVRVSLESLDCFCRKQHSMCALDDLDDTYSSGSLVAAISSVARAWIFDE
jgi:hypothetical protein